MVGRIIDCGKIHYKEKHITVCLPVGYGIYEDDIVRDNPIKNAYEAATEHMNKPEGDKPRPRSKYLHKLPMELG